MKKQILSIAVTLSVVIVLSVAALASMRGRLTANIPFAFSVNSVVLPAGEYALTQPNNPNLLTISNFAAKKSACVIVLNGETKGMNGKAQLVFRRYGDQYFLAQIHDGLSGASLEVPRSKAERAAAQGERHLAELITITAEVGQ